MAVQARLAREMLRAVRMAHRARRCVGFKCMQGVAVQAFGVPTGAVSPGQAGVAHGATSRIGFERVLLVAGAAIRHGGACDLLGLSRMAYRTRIVLAHEFRQVVLLVAGETLRHAGLCRLIQHIAMADTARLGPRLHLPRMRRMAAVAQQVPGWRFIPRYFGLRHGHGMADLAAVLGSDKLELARVDRILAVAVYALGVRFGRGHGKRGDSVAVASRAIAALGRQGGQMRVVAYAALALRMEGQRMLEDGGNLMAVLARRGEAGAEIVLSVAGGAIFMFGGGGSVDQHRALNGVAAGAGCRTLEAPVLLVVAVLALQVLLGLVFPGDIAAVGVAGLAQCAAQFVITEVRAVAFCTVLGMGANLVHDLTRRFGMASQTALLGGEIPAMRSVASAAIRMPRFKQLDGSHLSVAGDAHLWRLDRIFRVRIMAGGASKLHF